MTPYSDDDDVDIGIGCVMVYMGAAVKCDDY